MRPVKGLNKDSDERSQPEGTYREALNATLDEELGVLRREKGLEQAGQFTDETIQGHIILDSGTQDTDQTGNVILFLYDSNSGNSRIVEWDIPNQVTITHLDDSKGSGQINGIDGTLDLDKPIQAVYRKLETGDTVIYWTDGKRPPRFLNLSQSNPTKAQDLDIFGKIDSRLEFSLDDVRDFGGKLKGGTYQLAFAYVDEDNSVTNYFHVSNPVSITSKSGFGVDSETNTSKSIEFTLSNLDTDYPYVRIAAIKGTEVTILPDVSITGSSLTYTFTGNENSTIGSLDDIVVDGASYKTAGVIQEHEGTLYMADLTARDEVDLQKHVNDITLEAVTEPVSNVIDTTNPIEAFKEPEASSLGTFKRGEAYAFYISFLLRDGSETPAFHIPGPGDTTASGASSGDPFKADIIVNTDLPSPSAAAATGEFDASPIVDEATKASHTAIVINSQASVDDTLSVQYIDSNGTVQSSVQVSVTQGDRPSKIATDIIDALNANSTFSADFTASTGGTGSVKIEADVTGTTWNGYDVKVSAGNIDYTNKSGTTSGGKDSQSAPTHEITVDWDTDSVAVSVGSLTVPMTDSNIASAYVTALNNNTTFSGSFTASSSGATVTITADQNGVEYNAAVTVDDVTNGNELNSIVLQGGFATGDNVDLDVRVYDGASYTPISGLTTGMTKNNAASQIQSELNTNGPLGFNYTVTDNVVTIEDTNDRSIGGQAPDLRSGFSLGVTTSSYSSGGSNAKKAKGSITIEGSAPSLPSSPATGTGEAKATPSSSGTKAEGNVVQIGSNSSVDANFDAILRDDNDNVVSNISVQVFDGLTDSEIADRIVSALNLDSTFNQNWDASRVDTNKVKIKAKNVGTQYNDYSVTVENFSVSTPFYYTYPESTSGGTNSGGTYGDFKVDITWDNGNQSLAVNATVNSGRTKAQVAGDIVTALNNDTTFSNNYSATDNGDGTFDVTSTTNSSTYNGIMTITNQVTGITIDYEQLDGGNTGSEDITLRVYPYPGAAETKLTVPQQHPRDSVALDIYEALVNNSSYTGRLTFTINTNKITIVDEGQTSALNGESPSLVSEYTIPHSTTDFSGGGATGGSSGNLSEQLSKISSSHPLHSYNSEVSGDLRNFHVDAEKFQDGFSYWEQNGENYPDKDRWDIVKADGTSNGTVRNRPIRHHRFPEVTEEPYVNDDPNDTSRDLFLYGIKAKDVHVPQSIRDEVVGYKIYYAKKDPSSRLVLDQSIGIQGWLDESGRERHAQQADEVFDDSVWSAHGFPPFTKSSTKGGHLWDVDHTLLQLHPFESLRRGLGIQGVSHVKVVGTVGPESVKTEWDTFEKKSNIRKVNGVSYIDQNQRNVSLQDFGFSKDYDNVFGESKMIVELENGVSDQIPVCDICQIQTDIHVPYDNQELVSTGFVGDIDEDANDANAPDPPVIYGGDIKIGPWRYKAHTLLALSNRDHPTGSGADSWWDDSDGDNFWDDSNNLGGGLLLQRVKEQIFGGDFDDKEVTGFSDAIAEIIGNTTGIKNLPIVWGQMWYEVVETRDQPWFRTPGDTKIETFKPASDEWVANPDMEELPQEFEVQGVNEQEAYNKAKWTFEFFIESDNWLQYNTEYSRQNIVDSAFPFRANETAPTEFPTRIIRSAIVGESGERSAWRGFLQEDYVDLPQDKGRVVNIAPMGADMLIHTTEALFRTRADQRIKTTEDSAFVGSGDLFRPKPAEIISLDEGYGGLLDHRSAQSHENGYVFIDQEAGKVFFYSEQIHEISNQGMRKFFRDNLTPTSVPRVGYDPHTGRIFISNTETGNEWNYSFHPGLKSWVSNHSFQADYFFTSRDHLYSIIGDTVYRTSTGTPGQYEGQYQPFEIEYIQANPQPESQIVISLLIDSRVLESGVVVPDDTFDQFRIQNSYQDTSLTQIRPKTDENGSLRSNYNARLTDQAWKINEIRDNPSGPELSVDNRWKEQRRLADNFHRVKLVYDTDGRAIELFSSALITRASRR